MPFRPDRERHGVCNLREDQAFGGPGLELELRGGIVSQREMRNP